MHYTITLTKARPGPCGDPPCVRVDIVIHSATGVQSVVRRGVGTERQKRGGWLSSGVIYTGWRTRGLGRAYVDVLLGQLESELERSCAARRHFLPEFAVSLLAVGARVPRAGPPLRRTLTRRTVISTDTMQVAEEALRTGQGSQTLKSQTVDFAVREGEALWVGRVGRGRRSLHPTALLRPPCLHQAPRQPSEQRWSAVQECTRPTTTRHGGYELRRSTRGFLLRSHVVVRAALSTGSGVPWASAARLVSNCGHV
jgi:hypothetical protein